MGKSKPPRGPILTPQPEPVTEPIEEPTLKEIIQVLAAAVAKNTESIERLADAVYQFPEAIHDMMHPTPMKESPLEKQVGPAERHEEVRGGG